jgi:predicted nucleic acid-binding protein
LNSKPAAFARLDPARYVGTLARRRRDELPYDLKAVPPETALVLDATVYIDAQQSRLPEELAARIAGSEILHCAVALGEIAADLGLLDPAHPGTERVRRVLLETLERADPARTVAPSAAAWIEASVIAGILARTQSFSKADRRKVLNDALILLTACEAGAALVSRNSKDMDLLLQLRPDASVLLYDRRP